MNMSEIMDTPTLKGPGPTQKSASKKSWLFKTSNRKIFIFIKFRIQEGPVTRDPKKQTKNVLQQGSAVAGKNGLYVSECQYIAKHMNHMEVNTLSCL